MRGQSRGAFQTVLCKGSAHRWAGAGAAGASVDDKGKREDVGHGGKWAEVRVPHGIGLSGFVSY